MQFPLLDAAVILFIMYHILTKRFSWGKYTGQKWLLVFIGIMVISNVANLSRYTFYENIKGNLYLIRFILYSFVIGNVGETRISVSLQKKITYIGLMIAIVGILQFIFLPDLRFLQYQNWDDHLNRLTFPYLDPSFTGAILLVFLIINLFQRSDRLASQRSGSRPVTIILIEIIAIILTFSRATWVTGGIVLCIYMIETGLKRRWFKFRRGQVITFTFALLFLFIFVGESLTTLPMGRVTNPPLRQKGKSYGNELFRIETVRSRFNSFQKGLQIWQKNPLFGVGFNHYKTYQIKNGYKKNDLENRGEASVENSYVFVLATGGIIGLAAFLGWVLGVLRKLRGVKKYIFAAILIGSLFNNLFFYPFILLIVFWIISENLREYRGI